MRLSEIRNNVQYDNISSCKVRNLMAESDGSMFDEGLDDATDFGQSIVTVNSGVSSFSGIRSVMKCFTRSRSVSSAAPSLAQTRALENEPEFSCVSTSYFTAFRRSLFFQKITRLQASCI